MNEEQNDDPLRRTQQTIICVHVAGTKKNPQTLYEELINKIKLLPFRGWELN